MERKAFPCHPLIQGFEVVHRPYLPIFLGDQKEDSVWGGWLSTTITTPFSTREETSSCNWASCSAGKEGTLAFLSWTGSPTKGIWNPLTVCVSHLSFVNTFEVLAKWLPPWKAWQCKPYTPCFDQQYKLNLSARQNCHVLVNFFLWGALFPTR